LDIIIKKDVVVFSRKVEEVFVKSSKLCMRFVIS